MSGMDLEAMRPQWTAPTLAAAEVLIHKADVLDCPSVINLQAQQKPASPILAV